jgi:hypothetical protein
MIKKTIRMVLKLKDCDKVFKEGFAPGVLIEQDHEYTLPEDYSETMFSAQLMHDEDNFIHRNVEVIAREVNDE